MIYRTPSISSVNFRLATEADKHFPPYDYTKLTAILTCPTWGIVRYTHHKTFSNGGRQMALEAGETMHHLFAGVRLFDAYKEGAPWELIDSEGMRLFGERVWPEVRGMIKDYSKTDDERTVVLKFVLQIINISG
ncbi:hypothetical protein HC928_05070, partial [bacterium]|nr:hypothetical protein [bacterium]